MIQSQKERCQAMSYNLLKSYKKNARSGFTIQTKTISRDQLVYSSGSNPKFGVCFSLPSHLLFD